MKSTKTHVEVTFENQVNEDIDRDVLGACGGNYSKTRKAKFLFLDHGILQERRWDLRHGRNSVGREELRYNVLEDGRLAVEWLFDGIKGQRHYKKRS